MIKKPNPGERAIELLDAYTPSILASLARIDRVVTRLAGSGA